MNKEQLFKIREERGLEFSTLKNYRNYLSDVLRNPEEVPWIIGYRDSPVSQWRLAKLNPLDNNSRLTVVNYLAGLEELKTAKEDLYLKFERALMALPGTADNTKDYIGSEIMRTSFEADNVDYSLSLSWKVISQANGDRKSGYEAKTIIYTPRVQATMDRFCGPNLEKRVS